MTVMIISAQGGDIITAKMISETVADDLDTTAELAAFGESLELSVEFVKVEGNSILMTRKDCTRFIQQISDECDEETKVE